MGNLGWRARHGAVFALKDGALRLPEIDPANTPGDRGRRIRCPCCGWVPSRHDRWACTCRNVWNTFETQGVCPACGLAWADTQCLRCEEWSRHGDWYAEE